MESILKRTALTLLVATAFASTAAFAAPANNCGNNSRNAAPAKHVVAPQPKRQAKPAPRRAAPPQRQIHVVHHVAPAPQRIVVHQPAPAPHRYVRIAHDSRNTWRVGRPLPRTVVYHTAPAQYVRYLPAAPHGHRYVRIGNDIVLIAIGTRVVVDAHTGFYY